MFGSLSASVNDYEAGPVPRSLQLALAGPTDLLRGLAPSSPARMTKGIEYLYRAPTRADIKSDGSAIKVPVSVEKFSTQGFYQSTPGVTPTAYLKARLKNQSSRPMLGGPTHIFVDNQFIGDGQIATVAPKRQVEFGLGADESVKIVRTVLPETREDGVFSKHAITRYRVQIQIANYHRRKVDIEVLEPLPRSNKEDIEVKVISMRPPRPQEYAGRRCAHLPGHARGRRQAHH